MQGLKTMYLCNEAAKTRSRTESCLVLNVQITAALLLSQAKHQRDERGV